MQTSSSFPVPPKSNESNETKRDASDDDMDNMDNNDDNIVPDIVISVCLAAAVN